MHLLLSYYVFLFIRAYVWKFPRAILYWSGGDGRYVIFLLLKTLCIDCCFYDRLILQIRVVVKWELKDQNTKDVVCIEMGIEIES